MIALCLAEKRYTHFVRETDFLQIKIEVML